MKIRDSLRIGLIMTAVLTLLLAGWAAAETIPDPAQSEAEAFLESQKAAAQKDAWLLAVMESGAENAHLTDSGLTFSLCAFDPDVKGLGSYARAQDQAAWREGMLRNLSAHSLEVTLALESDGSVSQREARKAMDTIRRAVRAAKNGCTSKDVQSALTDLLFPLPTRERRPGAQALLSPDAAYAAWEDKQDALKDRDALWSALMYVQRNVRFSIKNGPRAVAVTWDGADPSRLLSQAYHAASGDLTGKSRAERVAEDGLEAFFREKLAETAIRMKSGRLARWSAEMDLSALAEGRVPADYEDYLARYTYKDTLTRLAEGYRMLPDEASLPMPKTGKFSVGPAKGRTVSVSIPVEGVSAYVQMRDADTGVIISDAFIAAGKQVNMKVSEGIYTVLYAEGTAWYGPEALFGPMGTYAASDEFIVGKAKWTLKVMEEQPGIVLHPVETSAFAATEDLSVHVKGVLAAQVPLGEYPAVNPAVPGESPLTGLPASGEAYTPVQIVLDNAEEAYPHWGVSKADIIFQVPNAGSGATKLLALFANEYPDDAGPVRSGRASMLPSAMAFQAAFAFAGPPAVKDDNIDIEALMNKWKMASTHRVYNLLHNNGFKDRRSGLIRSHDLSCHVSGIHDNLVQKAVAFEERPFLFADTPRTQGDAANIVRVLHHGEDADTPSNSASRAVFVYDEQTGAYSRRNSSGMYLDRDTGENVQFANVIVLRTKLSYEKNYVFLKSHLVGSGTAEIFQSGHYVRGAWVRTAVDGRLIFVDEDGQELRFQRGRTFIVITNEITEVVYTE